jgi:hypothetical protein
MMLGMRACAGLAVAAGFASMVFVSGAYAAPVRCADEKNVCLADCGKRARVPIPVCISTCQSRQIACQQSGCWKGDTSTYCGLLRQ